MVGRPFKKLYTTTTYCLLVGALEMLNACLWMHIIKIKPKQLLIAQIIIFIIIYNEIKEKDVGDGSRWNI